jgi:hypothetical protein
MCFRSIVSFKNNKIQIKTFLTCHVLIQYMFIEKATKNKQIEKKSYLNLINKMRKIINAQ